MADMSQIIIFNSMKREPFEATFPPKHFDQHMKNPLSANVRMTDFKIKENGIEVKVFCTIERRMGVEKISKWVNFFQYKISKYLS